MILFLFYSFISSSTGGDLVPPFVLESKNKVGFWELNGFSVVHDDYILISPPIQFTRGSLWTNLEFPDKDWSVQFELGISEGTGGGGFAIWFIDKYGADGNLYGGPSKFRGIAVSGSVQTVSDQTQISFKLLQDHGTLEFHKALDSDATIYLNEKTHVNITLRVSFQSGFMYLHYISEETNDWKQLCKMLVKVDISKNYLGITAQSDQQTSRFDLYSLNFSIIENSRKDASIEHHSTGHYSPEFTLRLRNPKFHQVLIEMGRKEESPDSESTAIQLLDVIHEINGAVYDAASFSDVNNFVTNTLSPYTQKWHRRTLKVINDIQNAMNVYGAVWNYTNILINDFKSDLQKSAKKIASKIENLEEILLSEKFEPAVNPNLGKVIVISLNANDFDPLILVLYISIAELTMAFSLLFLYQKRNLYE